MKINKLISRGLVLGFLLNSLSILSYANTEIPNRYQTLEGEYITIDDSTAGNLEEIEIFGNTIQDPNNLEYIQSVGDLYVDDEGTPILDSQGREQYKIDIVSNNTNFLKTSIELTKDKSIQTGLGEIVSWINDHSTVDFLEWNSIKNIQITFSSSLKSYTKIAFYDKSYKFLKMYEGSNYATGVVPIETKYFRITINYPILPDKDTKYQINIGNTPLKQDIHLSNKTSILLPTQLQKVGNITDRLYWCSEKGKYIIEKNISEKVYDGSDDELIAMHVQASLSFNCGKIDNTTYRGSIISNRVPSYSFIDVSNNSVYMNNGWLIYTQNDCGALVDDANYKKVNILREYLNVNPLTIYYPLDSSQLIETNITSKLKIPTYDEKTHIYVDSENGINPTLKITVDRIEQVSQQAVDVAISNPTFNNISLARMYINMLPESLYKDQLQEQLNNIFSSDIVLEKKNATANVDLYIKSDNILQMSLNTNSITFEDFSGVEDMTKENAVSIGINSSLPYSLNAYLPIEIQNSDKSNTMDKTILNIKENSEITYQTFTNTIDKIILKDNNPAGNNINHGIDIKLKGNIAHQKDVYKTTIKFEAEQK